MTVENMRVNRCDMYGRVYMMYMATVATHWWCYCYE